VRKENFSTLKVFLCAAVTVEFTSGNVGDIVWQALRFPGKYLSTRKRDAYDYSTMNTISFRSDTETLPTPEMLEAIARAPLGDDVYGEDPTVNRLEAAAAKRMGKEAALLVPTGTMGNLVALLAHAAPGDEVILDPESHIFYYEAGSMASVAGLMPRPVPSHDGILDPGDVAGAIRARNAHYPIPRLLCLENTHNRAGGRVVPLDIHRELCRVAHERRLAVHLDGARIFNAAIAAGVDASEFTKDVDSVMFCLSKGLSCPIGSMVCGTREFIDRARRCRKRLGGGMRQAGIIAAAGLVALEKMVDRLAEDHANAKRLAEGMNALPGFQVDLTKVETNIVNVDHRGAGLTTEAVLKRMENVGVLAGARSEHAIRMVTNRRHSRDIVDEALERLKRW